MFSNRFLPCEANIATIAKLRNMIWVVSKNGTILFSKISCFLLCYICNICILLVLQVQMAITVQVKYSQKEQTFPLFPRHLQKAINKSVVRELAKLNSMEE